MTTAVQIAAPLLPTDGVLRRVDASLTLDGGRSGGEERHREPSVRLDLPEQAASEPQRLRFAGSLRSPDDRDAATIPPGDAWGRSGLGGHGLCARPWGLTARATPPSDGGERWVN